MHTHGTNSTYKYGGMSLYVLIEWSRVLNLVEESTPYSTYLGHRKPREAHPLRWEPHDWVGLVGFTASMRLRYVQYSTVVTFSTYSTYIFCTYMA